MTRRLDEITRPESLAEANDVLRKHGYEKLGEGTFAHIWAKPGASMVLKIFTSRDDAYIDYANLVMGHQDNPHFPRLSGRLIRVTNDWRAVRMERLEPTNRIIYYKAAAEYLAWARLGGQNTWRTFAAANPPSAEKITLLFAKFPRYKEALDLLADNFLPHQFDLHDENVMLRGDVPVLTDPVA